MAQDRRSWTWGVAESSAEMERVDEEWWLALDAAARVALVYELSASLDWSADDDDDDVPRRIRGVDWGVRVGGG